MHNPTRHMAFGLDRGVETRDHDSHVAEAEALLNESWLSEDDMGRSSSTESMTSRLKTSWYAHREKPSIINNGSPTSDDAPQLALESLHDSNDLDNAHLRAQGHEAALQRSFSPLAALGLGFRLAP